jgi:hypothetical protein
MTTRSGRQYLPLSTVVSVTPTNPVTSVSSHKWSHQETFGCFDLANIQGGLHDLPKGVKSWLPSFSGKGVPSGNSHWTQFCESFEFHQTGQEHPDLFMRLFASSLTEDATTWIKSLPKGSIKTPEELEKAFKIRWCKQENAQSLYSQYIDICKGSSEGIRDFNDRFNLLLKKLRPNLNSEEAILQHYLNSLEGILQFTLKDRSPSTLEEAQDFAYQIEKNLEFEDYIHQVNLLHDNNPWGSSDENITETEPNLPEILEVKPMVLKRKWSTSHTNVQDVPLWEPPTEVEPFQDVFSHKNGEIEASLPQIYEDDILEEVPLFVHQVENVGSKYGEVTPFYVTLQVNDSLLHNCIFHPNATTNIMTEEVMHQLGLNLSQPNAQGGFAKGIIKNLNVAFNSCPSAPFNIDVIVVDALSNWGIILHKDLIMHLAGSFQDQESKVIISHPEGGFFTLYREPLVGSLVETFDEPSDQLLCINNDIDNWFVQGGSPGDDTIKTPEGIWTSRI